MLRNLYAEITRTFVLSSFQHIILDNNANSYTPNEYNSNSFFKRGLPAICSFQLKLTTKEPGLYIDDFNAVINRSLSLSLLKICKNKLIIYIKQNIHI